MKVQGKTRQVEKIDNGLQKGSKKKVELRTKIEEQDKDSYKRKKKKAMLQSERNNENRNASSKRRKREEVTKAKEKTRGPRVFVRFVQRRPEQQPL